MKLDRDKLDEELWEDLASSVYPDVEPSKEKEIDPQTPDSEMGDPKWNRHTQSKK